MKHPAFLIILVACVAIVLPANVTAQGTVGQTSPGLETASAESYTIRSVDFDVKGITLPFVLRQKVDPNGKLIGRRFADKALLEAFIADRKQVLVNERVLESAEASYEVTPAADGGYDVALHFATVDTWNIVALPYFKYDSNSGLLLSLRGRDYNFFGSMQKLELNLDYTRDENQDSAIGGQMSFNLPFQALGKDWSLGFSEEAKFWAGGVSDPRSITTLSLTMNLPGLGFPASLIASQGLSINEEAPDPDPDSWYLTSMLKAKGSIPVSRDLGSLNTNGYYHLGPLNYEPILSISENWKPGSLLEFEGRAGTVLRYIHGFSIGRADWTNNMRRGIELSVTNDNAFNLKTNSYTIDLDFDSSWHENLDGKIGIDLRAQALSRVFGNSLEDMGADLRGVLDSRMTGVQGAFINIGIPVKLFDFPTHAIIGKTWLDFELQAQPFLDLGAVRQKDQAWTKNDLWYAGGLELLFFPRAIRSFIVRASVGFDLQAVLENRSLTAQTFDDESPYEIFFGIGLKY